MRRLLAALLVMAGAGAWTCAQAQTVTCFDLGSGGGMLFMHCDFPRPLPPLQLPPQLQLPAGPPAPAYVAPPPTPYEREQQRERDAFAKDEALRNQGLTKLRHPDGTIEWVPIGRQR